MPCRLMASRIALVLLLSALMSCATPSPQPEPESLRRADEAEIRARSVFLCQRDLGTPPVLAKLPKDFAVGDAIREEDLAFLRGSAEAAPPLDPRIRPLSEELTRLIECEVAALSVRGCVATVFLRQNRPNPQEFAGLQEELSKARTRDELQEKLERWMRDHPARVTVTQEMSFVRTAGGWRADYQLPEKARGLDATHLINGGVAEWDPKQPAPQRLARGPVNGAQGASLSGVQGETTLKCVITAEGAVRHCRITKPLPPADEAMAEQLSCERWTPLMIEGRPVDAWYTFTVTFSPAR